MAHAPSLVLLGHADDALTVLALAVVLWWLTRPLRRWLAGYTEEPAPRVVDDPGSGWEAAD